MPNRDWIAAEFAKGIDAEQHMMTEARARADSPPDPATVVLYNQIAVEDERHVSAIETIATRYGYTPSRTPGGGGLGATLTRLKEKVSEIGTSPSRRVADDLLAKSDAIHWMIAWVHTFEAIGDTESARELAAVLTEEKAHRDALQTALSRIVEAGAKSESQQTTS